MKLVFTPEAEEMSATEDYICVSLRVGHRK